ncbi:hypothetical protein [Algibacter aquimarinus]|uniref:Por secretion system C-terminal sorting domain-containing protein n=1 Tax=Algibacter aquimarinus TaxID=1136748 RepID=A0ABP9HBR9_9FLAO
MKNVIKTLKKSLLVVTVFTAMLGNANEIFTDKVNLKKTALILKDVKAGNQLTIKDSNGIILYKELINFSGTYKKGFDLTALPDGNYFFVVDKDLEIKTIPFTVKLNDVVFDKTKEAVVYKPFVRQKDGLTYISKLALESEPLEIKIYAVVNGFYELAYTEKIEGKQTINRVFKLKKGNYKIELNSNNQDFTKFINN